MEGQRILLGNLPAGKGVPKHKIDEMYRLITSEGKEYNDSIKKLGQILNNKEVLIVAKGGSIIREKEKIQNYINQKNPVIIYVNHMEAIYEASEENVYFWYMDKERCEKHIEKYSKKNVIAFEGVSKCAEYVLAYNDINWQGMYSSDSVLIVLMLLSGLHNNVNVLLSGMDGDIASNIQIITTDQILKILRKSINISFLTESVYMKN